jgi:tRNA A-37 threonylcarbamoyl transferase component Bud32
VTEAGDPLLRDGAQLGRYRVLRRIGSGGMATVYEAEHGDLEKRVALKTLHPALSVDPEARARFLREGRAAARIRHPHVVEVFDVGQEGDTLYLVMEHLAGEDLGTLLGREGSLPVERLVDLVLPVIAAVMTAHEAGVVHRDLKPENIFLARARNGNTVPKVLDFGISKLSGAGAGPRLTGSAAMLGTPVYMSPEQARSGHVDARSDQYALGVILYECATGVLPFQAPELYPLLHAIVQGEHRPPRSLRPELPDALEVVIERAMHRDADARFASLRELGQALLPLASRTGRGVWREVFGMAPTPYGLEAPPALPVAPRVAQGTLLPRVRQVCVVTSAAVRSPRGLRWTAGGVAAAMVLVAAVLPSGARDVPTAPAAAPVVATPRPAAPPAVSAISPPAAARPAVIAAPTASPPPAPRATPSRAPPAPRGVARRVSVGADAGAFRLCGGVPCP